MPIPKKEKDKENNTKDNNSKEEHSKNNNSNKDEKRNKDIKKDSDKEKESQPNKEEIYDFKEENWQDHEAIDTEEIEGEKKQTKISLGIYRKIAFSFIIATLVLFSFIIYLYLVKVTIHIVPDTEKVNTNIIVDVIDSEKFTKLKDEKSIFGVVKEFEVTHSKTYESTGKKLINDEIVGKVEIFNKYGKNQPLVATTRLLTADNKLFRIKNTVNIPAGKSIEVEIYTDNPSKEMAISPTRLTIPGLWSGLQDKIFAKNNKPFIYQENAKRFILKADIMNAKEDLKAEIIKKAESEVGAMYANFDKFIYKIKEDSIEETIKVKPLDEFETFNITMKAKVSIVAFNNAPVEDLAQTKIQNELERGEKLIEIYDNSLEHHLDNYDINEGIATINSFFSGNIAYNSDGTLFEKEKILGLTKRQLEEYLEGLASVKSYRIEFKPKFIERVPNVIDRINIIVK